MLPTEPSNDALSILLVEHQKTDSELVCRAFENLGSQTPEQPHLTVVESLDEARKLLKNITPDLVITDIQLPDGNGLDLVPPDNDHAYPVLIVSSQAGEEAAVEAMKAGAIDYVVKSEATLTALPQRAARAIREWEMMLEHSHLQKEIIDIPHQKQQRLGQELHDGLGQQLTGLGLLARSLVNRLSIPAEQEMAEQLASGLEEALAEVRSIARGLVPVQMDAHGLVSALKELARRAEKQSGIEIDLQIEKPVLISDNETATHVYRIVQEAINNAIKHAQARLISMTLKADEDEAIIDVRDNGKGLPDNAHTNPGLGFRIMFHRCKLFGGSLDIYTHDEGGTHVRCCFPLHPPSQPDE